MAASINQLMLVGVVCYSAGCSDSGNSQRVDPSLSQESVTVTYDAPKLGASTFTLENDSLESLIATPEKISISEDLSAKSPLVFEGEFKHIRPHSAVVTVQFFQEHPKRGRVVTNEANGQLIEKDGIWTFRIPIDVPVNAGHHQLEVLCLESGVPDSGTPIKNHVIAVSDITVTKD